jgi:hypothetical protein
VKFTDRGRENYHKMLQQPDHPAIVMALFATHGKHAG